MRKSLGILLTLLVIVMAAGQAEAERGRGGGRGGRGRGGGQAQAPRVEVTPTSDQIVSAMEDIDWGWSHQKLISHFTSQLQKMYRPLLSKATDAITEDRLRSEMNARIARIKSSYVEFNGQHTGWDTSMLRDQYTHNNNESLVEVRELRTGSEDPRYTDYFFFINDRLWRRYRAFNQDQFEGIPFEGAAASFEKRFGSSRHITKGSRLIGLAWQDSKTLLEAQDQTDFYGIFCLVFSEKETSRQLDKLRVNTKASKSGLNPLVEALDDTSEHDAHADVVEHITGKRYNTAKQQPDAVAQPGKSKSRSVTDEPAPTPRKRTSGNPLDDLDI